MAASVAGTSHARIGTGCQDAYRIVVDEQSGIIVIAVADGAGSAPRADRGAEVATTVAVSTILASVVDGDLSESAMKLAFSTARQAVLSEAAASALSCREFACTLLLLVVTADGGFAGQIGDGLIAVRDHDDWAWAVWPQRGEYANTTRFLTEDDAVQAAEFVQIAPPASEVALMTDGLEPLALHYASQTIHSPFFEGMLPPLRAWHGNGEHSALSARLAEFLRSPRITERADDDLTLVIAARG